MNYFLAILQLILVGAVTLFEYKKRSTSVFLWAMSFLMFSVMHVVNVFNDMLLYPVWVYRNASLFVIGITFIYMLTRMIILRKNAAIHFDVTAVLTQDVNNTSKRFITYSITILIITMGYSMLTIVRASGGLFQSSWGTAYNYYFTQQYVSFDKLVKLFFLPCGSVFLFGLISREKKIITLTSLMILLFVLISRNKADLLTLITGPISYVIVTNKRIQIRNLILLVTMGIVGVYLIYALQTFRYLGALSDFIGNISLYEFNRMIMSRILSGQGELSLINVFYHFIYYDNNFPNFELGHTYIRMLLVFIPTSFSFGFKPTDFAISMGSAWMMNFNNSTFSTHPTLFGDVFANAGYIGILLGVLWGYIVFMFDKIADRKNIVLKLTLFNLFASNYILIGRGSVYNSFTSMVYGSIIICVIYIISRIRI